MTFYHLYADESRQQGHPCMLYGLLLIPRGEAEQELRRQRDQLRDQYQWGQGEFKWEKVSLSKIDVYKKFVDVFFACEAAKFRCLIVDKSKIDYSAYYKGDTETAFYEFYYQAISRNLQLKDEYLVFTDNRQNRQASRLTDLKSKINYYWLTQGATDNSTSGSFVFQMLKRSSKETRKPPSLLIRQSLLPRHSGRVFGGDWRLYGGIIPCIADISKRILAAVVELRVLLR